MDWARVWSSERVCVRFADVGNFVLDSGQEPTVQLLV